MHPWAPMPIGEAAFCSSCAQIDVFCTYQPATVGSPLIRLHPPPALSISPPPPPASVGSDKQQIAAAAFVMKKLQLGPVNASQFSTTPWACGQVGAQRRMDVWRP